VVDFENVPSGEIIEGTWRKDSNESLQFQVHNRTNSQEAKKLRDTFTDYFTTEGKVEWQERCSQIKM
jgi:hypothetical protein